MNMAENTSKTRIMNAALELFSQKGLNQVTIKDICELVGCSNGTFYYHFGSMNGLLNSFHQAHDIIDTELLTELLSLSSPWEKLWRIHKRFVDMQLSFGPSLYFEMVSRLDNEQKKSNLYNMEQMTQLILPIVRQGQEQGEILNHTPAEKLANTIGLTMFGVVYRAYLSSDQLDYESYMRRELENLYDLREDLRAT